MISTKREILTLQPVTEIAPPGIEPGLFCSRGTAVADVRPLYGPSTHRDARSRPSSAVTLPFQRPHSLRASHQNPHHERERLERLADLCGRTTAQGSLYAVQAIEAGR